MERILFTPESLGASLARAIAVVRDGGLVVYPTETMYGAGIDAKNSEAVSKLLSFKNRPAGKPISLLVSDEAMAASVVVLNQRAQELYRTFLPGPVTVISESNGVADARLSSEFNTLGIRISSYPLAQKLVEGFGSPITATSANASGKARPYSVDIMLANLTELQKSRIDLILDAGELPRNEPSTVIDAVNETQEVIRAGASFADVMEPMNTTSPEETGRVAERLMRSLMHALPEKAVLFALEGEMGAGKTHFAKGIAAALGVQEPVSSPTYAIQKEYDGESATFVHIDCWRLDVVEPELLGLGGYIHPRMVLAIEWVHPLLPYLREQAAHMVGYRIFIEHGEGDNRTLRIEEL